MVLGSCHTVDAMFFVDTGSAVSLVSKSFVDSLGITDRLRQTNFVLSSFTKTVIKTYGEITLNVEVANCRSRSTFVVTDLLDTHALLGMDFLSEHHITIDCPNRCLISDHGSVDFMSPPEPMKCTSIVKSANRVVIQPNTVIFIKGCSRDPSIRENVTYSGFIEPNGDLLQEKGLWVQSSLCHTDNRRMPVRVANLTDSPVMIHKELVLGTLYPIDNNCDADYRGISQPKTNVQNSRLDAAIYDCELPPDEQGETFKREPRHIPTGHFPLNEVEKGPAETSGSVWTKDRLWKELRLDEIENVADEQIGRLKELVWKYRGCFSTGPTDLGECTVYEGDIQLKPDYTPSWTPA